MTTTADAVLREDALLTVQDLVCTVKSSSGIFDAVAKITFDVLPGETLGLVGESGCGKTTTGRAVLQLPKPTSGTVIFDGVNLGPLGAREMRPVRRSLQMIFQDALSAFNPRRKVRDIVAEGLEIAGRPKPEIETRVNAALQQVGMNPDELVSTRPGELSGGQCQRVAIARALVLEPKLILCDEPVASLDVSVQAQVLNVLHDIREQNNLALVFISHDLAVVRNVSDRIAVMYLGRIVELGEADQVYSFPAHPYTRKLLDSVPVPNADVRIEPSDEIRTEAPSPANRPSGCAFRTRCPRAQAICAETDPELEATPNGQHVACHFPHVTPILS